MIAFLGLDPRLRPYAEATVEYARKLGIAVEVTSVRRTADEQRALRRKYEAGKWPYPVAEVGQSAHQWGVAWDSTVDPKHQATWDAIRRAMGWRVPSGDIVHAEVPGWQSYSSGLRYS